MLARFSSAFLVVANIVACERATASQKDVRSVNDVFSQLSLEFTKLSHKNATLKRELVASKNMFTTRGFKTRNDDVAAATAPQRYALSPIRVSGR